MSNTGPSPVGGGGLQLPYLLVFKAWKGHLSLNGFKASFQNPLNQKSGSAKAFFSIQTFILICVGYMSFYFAVDNFTDRVMVSLTTMLVIATVMSSIQSVSSILG